MKGSTVAWAKRIGLVCALLGLVLLVYWGVALAQIVAALQAHLAEAQALAGAAEMVDPEAACGLVADLRGDVVALNGHAGGVVGLAPLLGWLPGVGGSLKAAPHLLVVADGLTGAGDLACGALEPALGALSAAGEGSQGVTPEQAGLVLAAGQADLAQALVAVERARAAWAQVDAGDLLPELAEKVEVLDRGFPLLEAGLQMALAAPDLMGMNGRRTYLILAMNEDERRPIMGYITGVGEVQVEEGRLVAMTFRDSYRVDDFSQPYPDPPWPIMRYMGIDLWVLRDSNWSPDYVTAARQAISLYRPGYPVSVDGVVALDQHAVQQLVAALGPLEVPGAEEPVTGRTVIAYMRQAWAPEEGERLDGAWWGQRKSFIGPLAQAAWRRVEEGQVEWVTLARALSRLFAEKHLLVYLEQPEAASALAEVGWDGALDSGAGDFVMVVDANVGYNKASARVEEEIVYQVDLQASPPQASLTLDYAHGSTGDYPCIPEVRYDPVYEQMMDRCYWDYVRIYVPEGSQLLDATRIPVPGEALFSGQGETGEVTVEPAGEGPWLVFGALGLVPPSTSVMRAFAWNLPADVVQWGAGNGVYSLKVQKQPGTRGHSLTVRVRLPAGYTLLETSPEPSGAKGDWLIFETTLDRDVEFRLGF